MWPASGFFVQRDAISGSSPSTDFEDRHELIDDRLREFTHVEDREPNFLFSKTGLQRTALGHRQVGIPRVGQEYPSRFSVRWRSGSNLLGGR
jgi:hypothetical protein